MKERNLAVRRDRNFRGAQRIKIDSTYIVVEKEAELASMNLRKLEEIMQEKKIADQMASDIARAHMRHL